MRTLIVIRNLILGSLLVVASSCAVDVRSSGDGVAASRIDEVPASAEPALADEAATPDQLDGITTASCSVVCGTHCCQAPANFCGKNNACCDGVHCTINCPCF
jgi:hypothetical protein